MAQICCVCGRPFVRAVLPGHERECRKKRAGRVRVLPAALLLSAFAPWAVTPLLMLGGSYLCFEATEKLIEAFHPHPASEAIQELALNSVDLEKEKVQGAIRTDLILSAEIMAIALGDVADRPIAIFPDQRYPDGPHRAHLVDEAFERDERGGP
jgi:hypothetical protein